MKKLFMLLFLMTISLGQSQTLVGTWRVTSIGVGASQGQTNYFFLPASSGARACFFDDEYVFDADGDFHNVQQGETFLEGWQGGSDACGVPVAPHDGSNTATYSSTATTLTLTGVGAHLGLPKVITDSEISSPSAAPASITYLLTSLTSTTLTVDVPLSNGAWWRFVLSNEVVTPPPPIAVPTVAANTPTQAAGDVISIYSDAYSNVNVITFRTDWSNAGALENVTIAGNPTLKYNGLNFIGIDINPANQIDATSMENFHIDMWTPDCTVFRVKIVDFGADGAFGGGDDREHEVTRTPIQNGWNSFDLPLSEFTGLTTRANINQLVLVSSGGTAYVDNMYFWKLPAGSQSYYVDADGDGYGAGPATISTTPISGSVTNNTDCNDSSNVSYPGATEIADGLDNDCDGSVDEGFPPSTAAPTPPARNSADVVSIFSNAYSNVTLNELPTSWSDLTSFEPITIQSNNTWNFKGHFLGIVTNYDNGINLSDMTMMHIDYWTPDNIAINVKLVNTIASPVQDPIASLGAVETGTWKSVDIPLSAFGLTFDKSKITQILIDPDGNSQIYIDNFYFYREASSFNYYVDADGDGYGAGSVVSLAAPTAPMGYSVNNLDCNDSNSAVNPVATEVFDTIDNDCDGSVDEGAALPSSLSFCKGATVATAKGTTDLQLYTSTSPTSVALSGTTALSSKVYYATLNGSARTAVTITVNPLPSTPGTMTTTDTVLCKYIGTTNSVTYSVPAVANTTYNWSIPVGMNVVADANANDNSITVNFENSEPNNISVGGIGTIAARAVNTFGCQSAPRSLVLSSKLPTAPSSLVLTSLDNTPHFNQAVVPATSPATFNFVGLNALTKITKVGPYMGTTTEFILTAATAPTAASYAWTLPNGVNPIGNTSGREITVNFAGVEPGVGLLPIVVKSVGGCGESSARTLNLSRVVPTAPTALVLTDGISATPITKVGPYTRKTTVLTLTATPVRVQGATATSYAWLLPEGVNIVSPETTTSTIVQQRVNTGNFTPEGAPIFEIRDFTAISTGTVSTISVNFAGVASGTLSFPLTVFAVNGAGNSRARTRTVTAVAPTSPAITAVGGTTFNSCNLKTYSVVQTLGTSYTWSVPAGAIITSNTGNEIVVDYTNVVASVGASAQVTCIASNGTGSSAPRVLNVKRVACPLGGKTSDTAVANEFSVVAYPNPSSSEFNIETSAKGAMSVKVYDMQGRLVEKADTNRVGSRLAAGAYNVIVNQGANTKSVRVIKK